MVVVRCKVVFCTLSITMNVFYYLNSRVLRAVVFFVMCLGWVGFFWCVWKSYESTPHFDKSIGQLGEINGNTMFSMGVERLPPTCASIYCDNKWLFIATVPSNLTSEQGYGAAAAMYLQPGSHELSIHVPRLGEIHRQQITIVDHKTNYVFVTVRKRTPLSSSTNAIEGYIFVTTKITGAM